MCVKGSINQSYLMLNKTISVLIFSLYIAAFYFVYPNIGNTLPIISIIPVLFIYASFNLRIAIGMQFLLIAHRFIALKILGVNSDIMLSFSTILGICVNFMVLFWVSYLSMLYKKLRSTQKKLHLQNKELRISKNKADESERLKTTFISNISHEIRTPLNAIMGFSNLLEDPHLRYEERKEYLDIIKLSGKRLIKQIDNFIEMSSIIAEHELPIESEFNLNKLLEELYEYSSEKVKNNGEVKIYKCCDLPDGKDFVYSDRTLLSKILYHIIDNAIKYTNKGSIELKYKIVDNSELLFTVKDTGIGISTMYQHIVFDYFRQGGDEAYTRQFEGCGLGLTISKALVEILDGKIWYTSEPDLGSTFYFKIPYKTTKKRKSRFYFNQTIMN